MRNSLRTKHVADRAARGDIAGVYVRISEDREGREWGVERQEKECRTLAEQLGVPVHRIYKDNDRGASTRSTKPRPQYDAMLMDAASGRITMIICATAGRLTRRPVQNEQHIALAERHGVTYRYIKSPSFDLNTADGRMIARMLAAQDAAESERIGERVASRRRQRVTKGGFGGGRRPFGYGVVVGTREVVVFNDDGTEETTTVPRIDYDQINADEAAEMRKWKDAVLSGVPLNAITRDVIDRGVPTVAGGKWTSLTIRDILLRPRNAGIVVSHGEEIARVPSLAIWPEDVHLALVARLTSPTVEYTDGKGKRRVAQRRTTPIGPAVPVRWLGSCLYRCVCGSTMDVQVRANDKHHSPAYRCRRDGGTGDIHVRRNVAHVDNYVSGLVIERMSRDDAQELIAPPSDVDMPALRAERKTLRERLDGLAESFADGEINRSQLAKGTEKANTRLAEIEAKMMEATTVSPLAPLLDTDDVPAAWEALSLGSKRAAIDALMIVTIIPTGKGRGFNPDHVRIDWK